MIIPVKKWVEEFLQRIFLLASVIFAWNPHEFLRRILLDFFQTFSGFFPNFFRTFSGFFLDFFQTLFHFMQSFPEKGRKRSGKRSEKVGKSRKRSEKVGKGRKKSGKRSEKVWKKVGKNSSLLEKIQIFSRPFPKFFQIFSEVFPEKNWENKISMNLQFLIMIH